MLIPILLLACKTETSDPPITLEEVPKREAVTLQTLHRNTDTGLLLQARVVDEYNFAVPGQTLRFLETGSEEEESIVSDSFGYASLKPQFATESLAEATVTWDGQTGISASLAPTTPPSFRAYSAQYIPTAQTSNFITPMTDGTLVGFDTEIWWAPLQTNGFPHLVGNLPAAVQGIWSGHIDNDGILDAVTWTTDSIYLLRGAPNGGVSLEKEYTILLGSIIHVNIGAFDEGNHTDVSIAMTSDKFGYVTLLKGNGSWDFETEEILEIPFPIEAAVTSDENYDGYADVSVINNTSGAIHRYSFSIEGWVSAAHSIIDPSFYLAQPGTWFPPQVDLDSDGDEDLIVYGGEGSTSQSFAFFLTGPGLSKYEQDYAYYDATINDIDSDGSPDIVALSNEAKIFHTYFNTESQDFAVRTLNAPNVSGPLIAYTNGDDPLLDMRILLHQPSNVPSVLSEAGKWSVDLVYWREDSSLIIHNGHMIMKDADNDGLLEVAAIVDEDQAKKLRIFRYGQSREDLDIIKTVGFSDVELLDFKYCDGQFLTIVDNGTEKTLRATIFANGELSTVRSATVEQSTIDCATINGTGQYLLFGGPDASTYSVITSGFVQVDSGDIGSFKDMALGLGDDGSTHTVVGCTETDCQIEMADLDGDGDEEIVTKNSSGITIQGLGDPQTLQLSGIIDTVDITQDGIEDLLIREADTQHVWVVQGQSGHISSIFALWTDKDFTGIPQFADVPPNGEVEGDGIYEFGLVSSASTMITSQ